MILKSIGMKINYTFVMGFLQKSKLHNSGRENQRTEVKANIFCKTDREISAEIINIGMGDDAAETQSFFLPYCKRNQMEERIRLLLLNFMKQYRCRLYGSQ